MQNNLKSLTAILIVALVAGCDSQTPEPLAMEPLALKPSEILLYCDAESDEPIMLTGDDGSEIEATLSYRGFYRIGLEAETLEARFAGNDEFISLCSKGGRCKLVSNRSEIRFENHGRRWEDKIINETYVFERNTGHFSLKTEVSGTSAPETKYASGSCKSMNSIDEQLF